MERRRPLRVRAWILRRPEKARALAEALEPLFDRKREGLRVVEFWRDGTYFSHPARPKAVVIVLRPRRRYDPVGLGRAAARLLEDRHRVVLDWAGAVRGRAAWLIVKTWAADRESGRGREFRLGLDDIYALAALVRDWEEEG
jgi:hypothetical protein